MTTDVLDQLAALRERARAAASTGDAATGQAVLDEALALGMDESLPASRKLGRGLGGLAVELVGLADPTALESLLNTSLRVLQGASDARVGDLLLTWNNLAAVYDEYGASEHRNRVFRLIGGVAERYDGRLDEDCVTVFLELGDLYQRAGQYAPMVTMYRQLHRHLMADPAYSEADRSAWLQRYGFALVEAEQLDDAAPLLAQMVEAARRLQNPQRLVAGLATLANVQLQRGERTAALESMNEACTVLVGAGLADSEVAAPVYHNLVAVRLAQGPTEADAETAVLMDRALRITERSGDTTTSNYAIGLRQRADLADRLGEPDRAKAWLEQAIGVLEHAPDAQASHLASCFAVLGRVLERQQDWDGAARVFDRGAALLDRPAGEISDALSFAGHAWFKAGRFDAASQRYLCAVRRRAGLEPAS